MRTYATDNTQQTFGVLVSEYVHERHLIHCDGDRCCGEVDAVQISAKQCYKAMLCQHT